MSHQWGSALERCQRQAPLLECRRALVPPAQHQAARPPRPASPASLTKTDARGKVTTLTYDPGDRLTGVSYPTGTATVLEYDGGLSPTPQTKGALTKVTDDSGQASYAYDTAGRVTSKTQITNGKTFVATYAYGTTGSAIDKVVGMTYPSGSRVNYAYDAQGAVTAVTVNPVNANGAGVNTGVTTGVLSGIATNADLNVTGWTWQDGSTQAMTYNSFGILSGYNMGFATGTGTAAGEARTIVRDNAGRITGYTHTNNGASVPALDQSFSYDNLNRMLSTTLGGVTSSYSFDATGNRTTKVVGGTTYTNTLSATSNREVSVQDVGGTFSVVYDAAGNVTSDGVNTYAYSDRGRMASVTTAGGTVSYLYNAADQRVGKTGTQVPTGAAYFVYNEGGQLLGEYDANGAPIYETVYLGSLPVGVMKQTGTAGGNNIAVSLYSVHADHLGAPRIVTRQSDKAIVWRWDSAESYGGSAPNQDPNALGAFVFNQRFPGQVFDAETGLFQNMRREYNPRIGRYMQSDPIGLGGGVNTYEYVAGNPVQMVDPNGEVFFLAAPIVSGVVVGTVGALVTVGFKVYDAQKSNKPYTSQQFTRDAWTVGAAFAGGFLTGGAAAIAGGAAVVGAIPGITGGLGLSASEVAIVSATVRINADLVFSEALSVAFDDRVLDGWEVGTLILSNVVSAPFQNTTMRYVGENVKSEFLKGMRVFQGSGAQGGLNPWTMANTAAIVSTAIAGTLKNAIKKSMGTSGPKDPCLR